MNQMKDEMDEDEKMKKGKKSLTDDDGENVFFYYLVPFTPSQ